MSATESRMPKPVSTRAVQPAMPSSIMNIRFLNRKIFRRDTLCRNFRRRQRGVNRSRKIRLPAAGVLGRIRSAGVLRISWRQERKVTPAEHSREAASTMTSRTGS